MATRDESNSLYMPAISLAIYDMQDGGACNVSAR